MSKTEIAVGQMESWAVAPSHGYDQSSRWGPDYDCSSAVISAWELAGVPVRTSGASYTGNMRGVFLRCGFTDVTGNVDLITGAGLRRGDVLLNVRHHTAMYCGNGMEVEASINELGTTTGGQTGDQNGLEFLIRPYRNYPWDCVLRYTGDDTGDALDKPTHFYNVKLPLLKLGVEDAAVKALNLLLAGYGYYSEKVFDIFGNQTRLAVVNFQKDTGLEADGEVGGDTWAKLINR